MGIVTICKVERGFTLLEVMIAVLILAMGLLGLAALQIVAVKGNAFSGDMSYATALAQQTFEELNHCDHDDPALDASLNPHMQTVIGDRGVSYTVRWNVQDDVPGDNMKAVALEIVWDSARLGHSSQTVEQRQVTARFSTVLCP